LIRFALKSLGARKLRAALTAVAIVLGVAMIGGTYILTDTIKSAFGTVFQEVYKRTDVVITARSAIEEEGETERAVPPAFPESLLGQVRALNGVQQAQGGVSSTAQLVGRNGKVLSTGGSPGLAFGVHPHGNQRFNPLTLVAGRWPTGEGEVGIDDNTAERHGYRVGQTIGVIARGAERHMRIVGIARIGGVASLGGATMAVFDFNVAQRLFNLQRRLSSISIAVSPGHTRAQVVREIRPLLPPNAEVRTGTAQAKKATHDTSGFLDIIQNFLLAFAGIALFVGSFVIANTLSITIAQRTRELATLRTLGATRRQVLRTVLVEAFVIGLLASVTGLLLGIGLAKGLNSLFKSFGIDLPQASTVLATRTIVVSLAVGVGVTLLAALRPALRATHVPPIAAVREGAVLPPSRFARLGPLAAAVTLVGALVLMAVGLFVGGLSSGQRLLAIGVGAGAFFLAVALLARKLVPPLAAVLGWPSTKVAGVAGRLARANSERNPTRTASTAAALMIGLALVTFVAVLGAGLKSTFETAVNETFKADYVITATNNFSPISTASEKAVGAVPGVLSVSGVRTGSGRTFNKNISVTGVDPEISRSIRVHWKAGSPAVPAHLGTEGAFVSKEFADEHHLHLGSPINVETPAGGTMELRLQGIFKPNKGGSPFGDVTVSTGRFDSEYQDPQNIYAFVEVAGGANAAKTHGLQQVMQAFPNAKIQNQAEFKKNQEQGIDTLLNLLYVLLSLSIIVSLFGIVNTLLLSVFERTRELGMLRAVGMTRSQLRSMIRHESIVTALIGAALGIPIGILLALMVGQAIEYPAFRVPGGTIVVFVVAAVVCGLLAAIFPARRAARMNVLEALQYE